MNGWRASPSLEVFTDRVHELGILAQAAADLECGWPRHIALFGLRRIGKTLLCQEQMRHLTAQGRVIPVCMNLEGICTSPELFAQRYIGLTCFWAVASGQGSVEPCDRLRHHSHGADGARSRIPPLPAVARD